MLGELVTEIFLRPLFEVVILGLGYGTGWVFLKAVTLGALRLAPLASLGENNRKKIKWHQVDWSPWLSQPLKGRALRAEWTVAAGILVWVAFGCGVYLSGR